MTGRVRIIQAHPLLTAAFFVFFAVYAGSLNNGFHRDDFPHIVSNAFIRDLSSLPKLASRDYFQLNGSVAYRPAVAAVRCLEYKVFGLNPVLWRLFNLLLHAVNAALLCWIFLRVSGLPAAAAAGAALFLLHPAHTETLNYVSNGQCDLLCLFFLCVSFMAYLKESRPVSLSLFCLALLSKEMAAAFPLILAVYAWFYGDLRKKWEVPACGAALALLFIIWRLVYFKAGPGFIDNVQAEAAFGFSAGGLASAAGRFPLLIVYYLKLLLWPSVLSVELDRLLPEAGFFSGLNLTLAWLLAASLAAAAFFYRRNRAYVILFICFALALLPVAGLAPLTSLVQEHFVYIPSVFFCFSAGLVFAKAGEGKWRTAAIAAACLVLALSAGRIWARNADWKTPLALAQSDLRNFPGSGTALLNLALQKRAAGDQDGALALCSEAAEKGAAGGEVYFLMAELYLRGGAADKAVRAARLGLEKDPQKPDALVNAARVYAGAGLLPEALKTAREAARRFPYFEPAFSALGEILLLKKEPLEARAMFAEAVRLNSRSPAARRLEELDRAAAGAR